MAVGKVKAHIRGNLGEDPELQKVGNGTSLVEIPIAASVDRYDSDEGGYVEKVEWRTVTIMGRDAEYVAQYGSQGDLISLTATETTETYEDKDGIERTSIAYKYDMGDLALLSGSGGGGQSPEEQLDRESSDEEEFEPDDELPF